MRVHHQWRTRRLPRPAGSELHRLAVRAAGLAGLDAAYDWTLELQFLGDRAMAAANREFVGHEGTTDVITFCYLEDTASFFPGETGVELLICVDAALREGASRSDSDYARELVLYLVHGLLHSAGEDDLSPGPRRRMRRREREVLTVLEREFSFDAIFSL